MHVEWGRVGLGMIGLGRTACGLSGWVRQGGIG